MSPIKPENKARYPKDWKAIVATVRTRSGNHCECVGECGLEHANGRCNRKNGQRIGFGDRGSHVVLTTAHLDHTPENCDLSNLRHMCQRCHLRYDREHHARTRRRTIAAARKQRSLFPDVIEFPAVSQ